MFILKLYLLLYKIRIFYSYNKLSELPEDFFSNMPRLQDVHLINNNFQTIHEMPFSVAFKSVHLISMIGKYVLFQLLFSYDVVRIFLIYEKYSINTIIDEILALRL